MSDTTSDPLADVGSGDLDRFLEDGEGFEVVEEGEGDLPFYDWDQKNEEQLTEDVPPND